MTNSGLATMSEQLMVKQVCPVCRDDPLGTLHLCPLLLALRYGAASGAGNLSGHGLLPVSADVLPQHLHCIQVCFILQTKLGHKNRDNYYTHTYLCHLHARLSGSKSWYKSTLSKSPVCLSVCTHVTAADLQSQLLLCTCIVHTLKTSPHDLCYYCSLLTN